MNHKGIAIFTKIPISTNWCLPPASRHVLPSQLGTSSISFVYKIIILPTGLNCKPVILPPKNCENTS